MRLSIFFLFLLVMHSWVFSQTRTVISATCGSCKKHVPASSKTGDRCPHCGVRWGYENSTTTTTSTTAPNSQLYFDYNQKLAQNKAHNQPKNSNPTKSKLSPFASYSKQQIENWLEEKLNKYQQKRINCRFAPLHNCTTYSEYEFKLDGTYLIVKYNYDNIRDYIEYLPLHDFSYVHSTYNEISIANSKTIIQSSNGSNKSLTSYITIGYDTKAEHNIVENIESAFVHLKNLYTRPINEELPDMPFKSNLNKPTISETKEWILSKLNTLTSKRFDSSTGYGSYPILNPDFSFSNFDLIIKYRSSLNDIITIKIPICECNSGAVGSLTSYGYSTCNYSFSSPKENIIQDFNGKKNSLAYINLEINLKQEDDLFNRLQKALKNLKSYCPTISKPKEKF